MNMQKNGIQEFLYKFIFKNCFISSGGITFKRSGKGINKLEVQIPSIII